MLGSGDGSEWPPGSLSVGDRQSAGCRPRTRTAGLPWLKRNVPRAVLDRATRPLDLLLHSFTRRTSVPIGPGGEIPLDSLAEKPLAAFCGLGNPRSFWQLIDAFRWHKAAPFT